MRVWLKKDYEEKERENEFDMLFHFVKIHFFSHRPPEMRSVSNVKGEEMRRRSKRRSKRKKRKRRRRRRVDEHWL